MFQDVGGFYFSHFDEFATLNVIPSQLGPEQIFSLDFKAVSPIFL